MRLSTIGVVAGGALYIVAASQLDDAAQHLAAIALVVAVLAIARSAGLSADDMGLARARVRDGLRWGLALSAIAIGVVAVLAIVPAFRDLFEDDRYADATTGEVLYEVLVRIPLATALFEEVLFRGVLLGLLLRQTGTVAAVAISSTLFGVWHVVAATSFADANASVPDVLGADALVVVGTVAVTGVAGAFLAWLRLRSGSVIAPALLHAAVNSSALLAVWFVGR
jgi:membrane protease YdiL (CAAX protease family)